MSQPTQTVDGDAPIAARQQADSRHEPEVISESHAGKLSERRYHWVMDWRLVGYTALGAVFLMVAMAASYVYHSSKAASTFLSRADQAAADGKPAEEVRWLSSYLLLHPDDREKVIRAAISADTAAETATRENLVHRVTTARKRLGTAIAYLGTADEADDLQADMRRDLRKRLINRLIQSGGYFFKDVERHVRLLGAGQNDAEAHKWLAIALVGQVQEMLYQSRDANAVEHEDDYYGWLSHQPPGIVLREAVKRNADDLDLIGAFIALLQTEPETFGIVIASDEQNVESFTRTIASLDTDTAEVLDSVLLGLHARPDSRAKILLYRYASMAGENAKASELIKSAAAEASARLAAEDFSKPETGGDGSTENKPEPGLQLSEEAEALVWDYQCVYFGAGSIVDRAAVKMATDEEIKLATDWLSQLRDLGVDSVPVRPEAVKQTYLVSGLLAESSGDLDRAIDLWQEGLTVVNDDNLDLLGNVAWALARRAAEADESAKTTATDAADKAIQKFSGVINGKKSELMLMTSDQISLADRTAFAEAITNADWKKKVAQATVIAGKEPSSKNDREIIGLLDGLTDDEIRLEPQIRIAGISQLTGAYQRQLAWDLAATTLTEAAELFPTNEALVQASGEAWTRSGNRLQAAKQWQRARLSNVPRVRVASLEAEFAYQLRLIPEQREIATLRSRVRELDELLEKAGDTFAEEQLRLQTLRAQLPPEGVLAEEYLQSEELATKISTLADENPNNTELQMYAAERLAAAGKTEQAESVLKRLDSDQKLAPVQQQLLRARVLAASGKHAEAGELLLKAMEVDSQAATGLAQIASEYAKRSGSPDLAQQALLRIPEAQRTPAIYFSLYQIAKLQDQAGEMEQYLSELHRVEGYRADARAIGGQTETSPAYSLLIEATKLVEKLLARGGVQRDERDYTRAKTLISRLQSLRPNWGNAVALSGWLSFASGDYASAIEQLRRGINSGDRQLRTRQLLWQALLTLGRDEEAEREIRLAGIATQTDLDPYNEVSIGISIRKGDYSLALDSAKQIAEDNVDDPIAWLVYARFALVMRARAISDSGVAETLDAELLLKDANEAIDKAAGLAEMASQKSAVASARMSLAIAVGDRQQIERALNELQNGELKQGDRLLLEAKALIALDRIDDAIEKLKAANDLRPDFKAQMALVRLLRSRSRGGDALAILEQAFRQDPNNPRIRTELAAQLIDSGQEIDWDQIAKLLNSDQAVTEQNRLVYALLLASKGSHYQRQEAVRLLRDMAGSPTEIGLGASRVQAALMFEMVSQYDQLTPSEQKQFDKDQYIAEARRVFKQLAGRDNPALVDLTRYCAFLISINDEGDLDEARHVIDRLKTLPGSALEVLKIEMMLAGQGGDKEGLPAIVDQWANDPSTGNADTVAGGVETVAGDALMRNGFIDEGLAWFRRAYEANKDSFVNYIAALSLAGNHDLAAEVAADRYDEKPTATTAVLLVESLLAFDPEMIEPRYAQILDEAVKAYPDNAALNDSVATWAMQRGENERAIALYLKVLRLDQRRLRPLNNLAMIFAELPGRELEGLKHIDAAIEIAGDDAELLDTKGTVLLRGNRVQESVEQFEQAIESGEEKNLPRYQFHLVQALLELNRLQDAKKIWSEVNFQELDLQGLTPAERDALKQLHQRLGTNPSASKEAA
ncbi:tetratricopeptide repeat protein [Planctomycetes bacterium TBK1r]|uniref:Tetratricopeptide repeat protein n=1 Tax=Stieleria magnilauensis TaxID=2527963 RepID=A0ABX5XNH8_9BACT|nr:Tetratricopeptide repeat protein [Planctomycetes bacterium TBK1r]